MKMNKINNEENNHKLRTEEVLKTDAAAGAADVEHQALDAVTAYLESVGWRVLAISADRVERPLGGEHRSYIHEMIFRFTGSRKPPPKETRSNAAKEEKRK